MRKTVDITMATKLYEAGRSSVEIARMFGFDKNTVSGALRRSGVKMRKNKDTKGWCVSEPQIKAAWERYKNGEKTADLALAYGLSVSQMKFRLGRYGKLRQRDGHRHGPWAKPLPKLSYNFSSASLGRAVRSAIDSGKLVRKPCEKCGSNGRKSDGRYDVAAHHCDYNKPMDVMWLCSKCHYHWHMDNTAIPLEREAGVAHE